MLLGQLIQLFACFPSVHFSYPCAPCHISLVSTLGGLPSIPRALVSGIFAATATPPAILPGDAANRRSIRTQRLSQSRKLLQFIILARRRLSSQLQPLPCSPQNILVPTSAIGTRRPSFPRTGPRIFNAFRDLSFLSSSPSCIPILFDYAMEVPEPFHAQRSR